MNRNVQQHKASRDHEDAIALALKRTGFDSARRQPGSGNQDTNPNDVMSRECDLMLECKMTHRVTMTLDERWITRVIDKASTFFCRGALAIRFASKWPVRPRDYVVIPLPFFLHLLTSERHLTDAHSRRERAGCDCHIYETCAKCRPA